MGMPSIRRTAAVTASTIGLALAVAGPAAAETKSPTAPPAKKGCEVELKGPGAGQSIVYPHGHSFSVQAQNTGKTHTYTCNDGTWKETVTLTAGSTTGVFAPITVSTTLVLASAP